MSTDVCILLFLSLFGFCGINEVFTGNASVINSSVVSCGVDISPVHSYERSGRSGYWQFTWGVLLSDGGAERDQRIGVYLQVSYRIVPMSDTHT